MKNNSLQKEYSSYVLCLLQKRIQEEIERKQAEEEARRKEIEELEGRKRQEAESKWLQEQEARLQELKDQEKARQREQEAAAAAAAQAGIYSGVAPELLNNQIPSAPPGNLTYVPNDFNDTNRLIDIDSRPPAYKPLPPDRELKKNLVINDEPSTM